MTPEDVDLKTVAFELVKRISLKSKNVPVDRLLIHEIAKALKQARAEGFKAGISLGIDAAILQSNPTY